MYLHFLLHSALLLALEVFVSRGAKTLKYKNTAQDKKLTHFINTSVTEKNSYIKIAASRYKMVIIQILQVRKFLVEAYFDLIGKNWGFFSALF